MKSMEDYINEVYEKYEESERKHEVYKRVKVKYHNPLTTLCGVATCVLLLCVGVFSVNKFNKEPEIKYAYSEKEKDGTVIYTKYIKVDNKFEDVINKIIADSDSIAIVSKYSDIECGYTVKKEQFLLETMGLLTTNKILKGHINSNEIKYSKFCGIISLAELQENANYDWKEWELLYLGKNIPEEEKATTYFRQIPTKGCEIEEGKQYLVFMKYDEENDIYNIFDIAYGIMEYDPNTKMIKNIDTGEFQEFDWSLIS